MGLEDFEKIDNVFDEKDDLEDSSIISEVEFDSVKYYLLHIDELIDEVEKSYREYLNAKIKYEFKKDELQTTINWSEENALRESNNLPKVTTQPQRDSVVKLKTKNLYVTMEECEIKYKFYNKMFSFISNNFELLSKLFKIDEK